VELGSLGGEANSGMAPQIEKQLLQKLLGQENEQQIDDM
jgi:hypothetical protein